MFKSCTSPFLCKILAKLLETIKSKGIIPDNFNVSIIQPLIKNPQKSNRDLNNICPISLPDIVANIFERVMLIEIDECHSNHDKPFGYKKYSSCSNACFVLFETIIYSRHCKTRIYVTSIDASKAFDKVDRKKLWIKLLKKTNQIITRVIMKYYSESKAKIKSNDEISDYFKTSIGVKQGGSLSPRLFAIYLEDALEEISELKLGIQIGTSNMDIIAYADNILLITNNQKNMQRMLNCLKRYGEVNKIKFNPSKTHYMVFNETFSRKNRDLKDNMYKLKFQGDFINKVNEMKYLGFHITNQLNNKKHVKECIKKTVGSSLLLKSI